MVKPEESDLDAAAREFEEETGWPAPRERWIHLGETVMRSRKVVVTWAIEHDFDLETFSPGMFTMHGREYPEIDRVGWVPPERARVLLNPAFSIFMDRLEDHLSFNGRKE